MKNKKLLFILVAVAILAAVLIIINQLQKPKESKLIKIGALIPLTGPSAFVGEYTKTSAMLVKDLYLQKFGDLGAELQIIFEDTKGQPVEAVTAYKKMVLEHREIKVILTQMSSVANALAPIADKEHKLIISISATLEPLKITNNYYVNYLDAKTQATKYLEFLKTAEKISVFYVNDEYGRSIVEEIKNMGMNKDFNFVPFDMNVETKNLVNKIRVNEDAVIIIGYGTKLADIIKNLRIINFKNTILCSAELLVKNVLEVLKGYEDNVFVIDISALPKDVSSLYQLKYKRNPVIGDILTFNGLSLVMEAYLKYIKAGGNLNNLNINKLRELLKEQDVLDKVPCIKEVRDNVFVYQAIIKPLKEINYE